MKTLLFLLLGTLGAGAESSSLSVQRLQLMDQRGYFTPAFKRTVHDLVKAREALKQAQADHARLAASVPALQAQGDAAAARTSHLRSELELYLHPEEADFEALQKAMKNPALAPQEQLKLAQAYVWSYPSDPHEPDAEGYLEQIQKQLAAQKQALANSAASRAAARALLLKRVRARSLSLAEWQDFLQDMSQEDLLHYLGPPTRQMDGQWLYAGSWVADPATSQRVGLLINFNGTRVLSVVAATP